MVFQRCAHVRWCRPTRSGALRIAQAPAPFPASSAATKFEAARRTQATCSRLPTDWAPKALAGQDERAGAHEHGERAAKAHRSVSAVEIRCMSFRRHGAPTADTYRRRAGGLSGHGAARGGRRSPCRSLRPATCAGWRAAGRHWAARGGLPAAVGLGALASAVLDAEVSPGVIQAKARRQFAA